MKVMNKLKNGQIDVRFDEDILKRVLQTAKYATGLPDTTRDNRVLNQWIKDFLKEIDNLK